MTEMSFTRLIQMTERHPLMIQVNQRHLSQRINLNESPSQDLDHGGYSPLKQLVSHLGLPHADHKALETIHLDSKTS